MSVRDVHEFDPGLQPSRDSRQHSVSTVSLRVRGLYDELGETRVIRMEAGAQRMTRDYPGRQVKVGVPISGRTVWKTLTMTSSPTDGEFLDIGVRLVGSDPVASYLFQNIQVGDWLKLAGPQGEFFFDPNEHTEPLVLIARGAGVFPVLSIARFLEATASVQECLVVHSDETPQQLPFKREFQRLAARMSNFRYLAVVDRARANWHGLVGILKIEQLSSLLGIEQWLGRRFFIAGQPSVVSRLSSEVSRFATRADFIHQLAIR